MTCKALALIDAGSEKLPLIKDMEGIVVVTNLLEKIFNTLQMISNLRMTPSPRHKESHV